MTAENRTTPQELYVSTILEKFVTSKTAYDAQSHVLDNEGKPLISYTADLRHVQIIMPDGAVRKFDEVNKVVDENTGLKAIAWKEEGTDTLRISCPGHSGSAPDYLALEELSQGRTSPQITPMVSFLEDTLDKLKTEAPKTDNVVFGGHSIGSSPVLLANWWLNHHTNIKSQAIMLDSFGAASAAEALSQILSRTEGRSPQELKKELAENVTSIRTDPPTAVALVVLGNDQENNAKMSETLGENKIIKMPVHLMEGWDNHRANDVASEMYRQMKQGKPDIIMNGVLQHRDDAVHSLVTDAEPGIKWAMDQTALTRALEPAVKWFGAHAGLLDRKAPPIPAQDVVPSLVTEKMAPVVKWYVDDIRTAVTDLLGYRAAPEAITAEALQHAIEKANTAYPEKATTPPVPADSELAHGVTVPPILAPQQKTR